MGMSRRTSKPLLKPLHRVLCLLLLRQTPFSNSTLEVSCRFHAALNWIMVYWQLDMVWKMARSTGRSRTVGAPRGASTVTFGCRRVKVGKENAASLHRLVT